MQKQDEGELHLELQREILWKKGLHQKPLSGLVQHSKGEDGNLQKQGPAKQDTFQTMVGWREAHFPKWLPQILKDHQKTSFEDL